MSGEDRVKKAARDKANRQSRLAMTAANGGIAPVAKHNASVYTNWGCRCKICLDDVGYHRGRKKRGTATARHVLTDDEQRELLTRLRPRLKRMAATLTRYSDFADELAQEGWVEIWREVTAKGLMPDGILMNCARSKMHDIIRYNTQQCRDIRVTVPISALAWEDGNGDMDDLFGGIEVDLTEVEAEYHDGRILDAVNKLPQKQRDYVIRRFWYGWTKAPLEVYFDMNPNNIWRYARKNLEKNLAEMGVTV